MTDDFEKQIRTISDWNQLAERESDTLDQNLDTV